MQPSLKELGALIEGLRKDPDSHLLVAGGKPSLFTEDVRNLPRVTFWHSTEHNSRQCTAPVPSRTAAIVFNRWIDHSLTGNLRKEAKRLGIPMCNVPLGPSTILDLIKEAGLDGSETPTVISDAAPVVMGRGRLRAFILQESDLRAPVGTEVPRLFALAQERGLPTTMASISTTFYQVRAAELGIVRVRRMDAADVVPVRPMDSEIDPIPTPVLVSADAPIEPWLKPADDIDKPNVFATVVGLNRAIRHAKDDYDAAVKERAAAEEEAMAAMAAEDAAHAAQKAAEAPPAPDYIVPFEHHDASPIEVVTLAAEGKAWINPDKPIMETRQVLALIDDAIVNLQKLTGDAVSALQLVHEAIEGIAPMLAESAKLQAKIAKMKAFLNE